MKIARYIFALLILGAQTMVAADKLPAAIPPRKTPAAQASAGVRSASAFHLATGPSPAVRAKAGELATLGGIAITPRKNSITPLNGAAIKRKP